MNSATRVESNRSSPFFSSTLLAGESTNTTQDDSKIISCLSKIATLRNKGVIKLSNKHLLQTANIIPKKKKTFKNI